jgi:dTDP-3-amino-3,4,6-trideoxy-alpha-D-glucose transaminase
MSDATRIPFVDLAHDHSELIEELRAAFERVVASSGFILGREVEQFEREFAAFTGTRHCVGIASGTAALTLMMIAAEIGPGDEVIVPAHTYIASALGILHAGATPVLCDVEEGTGLIDCESARACVSDRTAAILAVHLYGQTCDMERVRALADSHGLLVLEDAAQAHGAVDGGRRAGSLGTAAAFSFYPGKNLGALGDGGAITTDDETIAERARQLRDIGQRGKGEHVVAGFNERLDGLQAAFLRAKLARLDGWNASRRRAAAAYRDALPGSVHLLAERAPDSCVYHLFPIRVPARDALREHFGAAAIATGIHYAPALHHQPAMADRFRQPVELPVAERWAREELSLPMFPSLSAAQVERVAEVYAAASLG